MHARPVAGFSLIEVLVAVLVLAIGVLGTAAAQLAALQTRQDTSLMSSGVDVAASLAERMRGNRQQVAAYLQYDYDALSGAPAGQGAACHGTAQCDSAQMAALDLAETSAAVHAGFPGGRIKVCRDATHGATLSWTCGGGANAPVVVKLGWRSKSDQADAESTFIPSLAIVAFGALP